MGKIVKFLKLVFLDIYALLLFILIIISLLVIFINIRFFSKYIILLILISFVLIFIFKQAINIQLRLKHKYRSYLLLKSRNTKYFKSNSFEKYMNAPCTRLVVLLVLYEINRLYEYKLLKKLYSRKYYKNKNYSKVILYDNGVLSRVDILK